MTEKKLAYLFLDDCNIQSLDGVAHGVVPARKVFDKPLIVKDQPWEQHWHIGGYINVMYDHDDKLFKLWYGVGRKLSDARGEQTGGLAYAVSQDGIKWEKPILNLVEDNGSKANNLVFPMFRWGAGTGVMKDPIETDPAKRYKMLFMFQCEHMAFAGITQPVCVAYSPDGIHWDVPRNWLNPVIPTGTDTQLTVYWEPKIRKYVVYLRGRPNIRLICQAQSDDFESWTDREIVVQPDELDPPQDHEFYGMTSMPYRDFRIGFLSVFHTLNEGWIALNQIEDWMPQWMNQMDIQLTYTKDGRTWHRAGNRQPILLCGPAGGFDSGSVHPPHAPFVLNDEIWLYYAGSNELHGEPPRSDEEPIHGIGLAKIKKDRFVCLETNRQGLVTTASLGINPRAVSINADATGGAIQAEIVDPFDRVIPGFTKEDSVPFTGDASDHPLQWRNASNAPNDTAKEGFEAKMVSQAVGAFKIKIYLNNARLFAIYSDTA